MGILNTAMNALGTLAAIKSLTGGTAASADTQNRYNRFLSEIRSTSVARTNLFEIVILPPRILASDETSKKISLYAEGTSLPGIFIQTDGSIKPFGVGQAEVVPYGMNFNDITVTFIGDGKGEIYKFFYKWMHGITRYDYDVSGNDVGYNNLAPYEVEFKANYKTSMVLNVYNEQMDVVLSYEISDAFPKTIPEISLNWGNSDYMQIPVTFSYFKAKLQNADVPLKVTSGGINQLSPLQKLVKIGTAVQTISSLKVPSNVNQAIAAVSSIKNVIRGFGG